MNPFGYAANIVVSFVDSITYGAPPLHRALVWCAVAVVVGAGVYEGGARFRKFVLSQPNPGLFLSYWAAGCALLGFLWFVWPTPYRYDRYQRDGMTTTIRTNRFTDDTQRLTPNGWLPRVASTPATQDR